MPGDPVKAVGAEKRTQIPLRRPVQDKATTSTYGLLSAGRSFRAMGHLGPSFCLSGIIYIIYRSEGVRPRNGLCHSCACGRVAGGVGLLGSAGRLGFVAAPPLAMGGRFFSRYVSGDGAYTDVFS